MTTLNIKDLGLVDYSTALASMKSLIKQRKTKAMDDEIWLLEHPPTFTQGQAGKPEHILQQGPIPIIQTDRGGQVTYHGPGQLIVYLLMDLKQRNYGIRELVCRLEKSAIACLKNYNIDAEGRRHMPGVYVNNRKIASVGLRVTRGFTYHGMSINIDMDLTPFDQINTCGYPDLAVTQLKDYAPQVTLQAVKQQLSRSLQTHLA